MAAERVIDTKHPLFGVLEGSLKTALLAVGIEEQYIPGHNYDLASHTVSGYPVTATVDTFFDSIPYAVRIKLFLDEEDKNPGWKASEARGVRTDVGPYLNDDFVCLFGNQGVTLAREYTSIDHHDYEEDPFGFMDEGPGKTKEYPMVVRRMMVKGA